MHMEFPKISRLLSCQWQVTVLLFAMSVGIVQVVGETNWKNKTGFNKTGFNETGLRNVNESFTVFVILRHVGFVECLIGIVSNSFLLLVIYCNPLKNLRRASWIPITNLAVADLLTSIFSIYIWDPVFSMLESASKRALDWADAFLHVGYSSSFFLLLFFAIERYIAIKYPLRIATIMTKRRVFQGCVLCWAAAIVFGGVTLHIGPSRANILVALYAILELTVFVMIVFQVLIIKNINAASGCVAGDDANRNAKMKNTLTTIVILITVLMVTAFPYFIGKQLEFLKRIYPNSFPGKMFYYFPYYYFPIACLNFIINPFTYAWRLPDYRWSFVVLVKRKLLCKETTMRTNSKGTGLVSRETMM